MAERRLQAETREWETRHPPGRGVGEAAARRQPAKQQGRGSSWRETGHSGGASWRLPWPCAGPTQVSLPGTTSRFAPKGLIRKKVGLWMNSADVRQDQAGFMKEKGPAGHNGKTVS